MVDPQKMLRYIVKKAATLTFRPKGGKVRSTSVMNLKQFARDRVKRYKKCKKC